ncbi:DUF3604 domain-containing protein [Parerythrobacter jejuensis]|uniref:DUF3604 domain-containing protein n=1 Tax=Parerythrobacter jejuensis TaxID=795812 RepID=A0A845AVU9_9SPHN|nr:DUF3604 domain-containing protein [Parerythrobacter jejuensis]MXP30543.1 DUF3604 domain-containing protein [Parerythrobacter jejuensis]MXP33303.1 DUF3604 domain-containing protein [Parerythrobacter jejuensis]
MRKRWIAAGVAAVALAGGAAWYTGMFKERANATQASNGEGSVELAAYPDRVYWGDTHLHTDNSVDAFGFGVRIGPEEALRFARGDKVTSTTGREAQLARPLDFLVIADHSDALGATKRLMNAPSVLVRDPTLKRWQEMLRAGGDDSVRAVAELIDAAANDEIPEAMRDPEANRQATQDIWQEHLRIVDLFNEPGKFTAFAGFEWTLMPDGNNLHRVVMFRDGAPTIGDTLPYPGLDGEVEGLWDYLAAYEESTGGGALAIPHNSNLSNGIMFEMRGPDGQPMSEDYASKRARWEPVVEVTQIKGDSESHPFLSPNDEFAGYGVWGWELGNLPMNERATPDMYGGSYVREALKRGLSIEQRLGVNPYRFGLIGSTDSHTALATADEDNFFGKHTGNEPKAERAMRGQNLGTRQGRFGWHYLASGYAAAWARGNTRAEIFDAFKRREVYATTGSRMSVRVFGGFDFGENSFGTDWVENGYANGVPMGGVLDDRGSAPSFVIEALKDPEGANLDRVQVVKGWVDASGQTQERVFDVVWADQENRAAVGSKVPAIGSTVDESKASYTNDIGAAQLRTVWSDPEYREGQRAFYYVRVIEIPTPRWVLFDAIMFDLTLPDEVVKVVQERAYTSPIWLLPKSDDA